TDAAITYATNAARESIVFINTLITQPSADLQGESHDQISAH
ncbi:PTS mannose transporter subunit IIAB, partial [Salmonella enterica subsp. enterica serovar Montevideo]|nr:PTS mannose transporter subunit IIAB [Salmonella enterica subsp. enterica serovar Montevideo]